MLILFKILYDFLYLILVLVLVNDDKVVILREDIVHYALFSVGILDHKQ